MRRRQIRAFAGSVRWRVGPPVARQAQDEVGRQCSGACPFPEGQGLGDYGSGSRSMERIGGRVVGLQDLKYQQIKQEQVWYWFVHK